MNRIPTRQRGITLSAPLGSPLGLRTAYHLNWPSVIDHDHDHDRGNLDLNLRTLAASIRNTPPGSRLDRLDWEPYESSQGTDPFGYWDPSLERPPFSYWVPIWRFADGRRVRFWEVMTEDAPLIKRLLSSPELQVEALDAVIM